MKRSEKRELRSENEFSGEAAGAPLGKMREGGRGWNTSRFSLLATRFFP
jgi:hypothetical protein